MQRLLATAPPDSNRVLLLIQLAWDRTDDDPLAAIGYGKQSLQLARRLHFGTGECRALLMLGWAFMRTGNYPTALQTQLQARRLAESIGYPGGIIHANNALGYAYAEQGNPHLALPYYLQAKALAETRRDYVLLTPILGNIGQAYLQLQQPDSAWRYTHLGYEYDLRFHDRHSEIGDLSLLGDVEVQRGDSAAARRYYRASIARAQGMPVSYALCRSYLGLARLAHGRQAPDSALYYGRLALQASRQGRYTKGVFEASGYLADIHAQAGNHRQAYQYLTIAASTRDSLFSHTQVAQVQALAFSAQLRQAELAEQRLQAAARRRHILLLATLAAGAVLAVLAYLLLSRRQLRQKMQFAQERQRLERLSAEAVLRAEEGERHRIGADLHDGVGQLLSVVKLNIDALSEELAPRLSADEQHRFNDALDVVDESVREVRHISHNLLPNALIKRGLARAVREFLDKVQQIGRLRIHLETLGLDNPRLAPDVESALYRVVQEAVQNIVKHAQATEITLQLIRHPQELTLLVEDNGVGFNPEPVAGIGLKNMQSRVAYLGGVLNLDSRPGHGTTITATVPLPPADPSQIN